MAEVKVAYRVEFMNIEEITFDHLVCFPYMF